MFCHNCGKQIQENDNFCRYCGADLRTIYETQITEPAADNTPEEEFVLYEVKKHIRSLVIPAFLTPLFFFYFWNIFLNTHSFFSWIIVIAILMLIIYPIARYKSDKIIITTKFAHIKIGVLNPEETAIPIENFGHFEIVQSSMGRFLDYGHLTLLSNGDYIDYGYIKEPEEVQYIIDNPFEYIHESLQETISQV